MIAYQAGSVLFCRDIPDEQGRNHKDRFVLVVEDCLIDDAQLAAVAITSQEAQCRQAPRVQLQYGPSGRTPTGLTKLSFAVCSWLLVVDVENVERKTGHVRTTHLEEVLRLVDELHRTGEPPA